MITAFENTHNMYLLDRPMDVAYIEQGVILPHKEDKNGPRWGLGGVCDKDNRFVELSAYDGGWATHGGIYEWDPDSEINCDCEVVYFGMFFNHWGHFLVDLLGRLWYFAQNKVEKGIKIAYLGDEEPKGTFLEFFSLLGIEKGDFIHITQPTRFKKVIVPEYSCKSCQWFTDEYRSIFDRLIQKVVEDGYVPQNLPDIKKVYFSRLSFGKAKATEFGEAKIAEWFVANGFSVIAPETLDLKSQIYVWNNAEEIACLNGSIPLSIALSGNKNLKLTVLNKTSLEHLNLDLYLLMRDCDVVILDAYREPFKKYPKSIGGGPFLLHLSDDIKEYSRQNGYVFPFTEKEISREYFVNYFKLVLAILNLKGRTRLLLSRIMPDKLKKSIRKVLGRG